MILTRNDIQQLINQGTLVFEPSLDIFQNQPHAIDLRLGTVFYLSKTWRLTKLGREILTVDVTQKQDDNFSKIELEPGQFFELAPGEAVLGSTLEKITLHSPEIMGLLYPRSSINRRGLSVDLTGIVDAYYSGHLIIPIHNRTQSQVIRVYPGERICQVVLQRLTRELGREEAIRHGKISAKYNDSTNTDLLSKQDDPAEIKLIKSGHWQELKKQFPFQSD